MAKKYPKLSKVLKQLLFERDMKSADLARAVDMPPPTVHRLVTGKSTRPYQSSIDAISAFFNVSQEQLLGEKPLSTDTEQKTHTTSSQPVPASHGISYVPLVPWNKIADYDKENNNYDKIPCLGELSDESFAVIMQDSSMSPIFDKGCMLIFDPHKNATDRSFILARIAENNAVVFRQMLTDMDHQYLKPLNPDLNVFQMRLLSDKDEIIATLVESRQMYSDELTTGANHAI